MIQCVAFTLYLVNQLYLLQYMFRSCAVAISGLDKVSSGMGKAVDQRYVVDLYNAVVSGVHVSLQRTVKMFSISDGPSRPDGLIIKNHQLINTVQEEPIISFMGSAFLIFIQDWYSGFVGLTVVSLQCFGYQGFIKSCSQLRYLSKIIAQGRIRQFNSVSFQAVAADDTEKDGHRSCQ